MNEKPILAIETSGKLCGAAIFFNDSDYCSFSSLKKNSHSEKVFELIDKVLDITGINLSDLQCIAVSSGPGSFTGLRIGLSAAKGIAFGSSIPICPVPTFEALALQFKDYLDEGDKFIIANKINLDELYFAGFFIKSNNYIFADNLQIIRKTELLNLTKGKLVFGDNDLSNNKISTPDVVSIAKWCRKYGDDLITTDIDYIEPNYLKKFIVKDKK